MGLRNIGQGVIQYITGALTTIFSLGIIAVFGAFLLIRLFNIDPEPSIMNFARLISRGELVEFQQAFNTSANPSHRICEVARVDTDGDGFREWLVFYQSDTVQDGNIFRPCPDASPRRAVIYDNDRGDPPVIFPYTLEPPDGDYLGAAGIEFEMHEVVPNVADSPDGVEELFIYGYGGGLRNQLAIFSYRKNSEPWDTPTNQTPRYQLIGFFNGNGGVSYNEDTRAVTVKSYGADLARSQLAVENVYNLQENGTYFNTLSVASGVAPPLASPARSAVEYALGPPAELLNTQYPEKIALAFFKSLDSADNQNQGWTTGDFLASNSQAGDQAASGGLLRYLGFPSNSPLSNVLVTRLRFFPDVEQAGAQAASTTFGATAGSSVVEVSAQAQQDGQTVFSEGIIFKMVREGSAEGNRWKVEKRCLSLQDCSN